jgi:hypothetical protein
MERANCIVRLGGLLTNTVPKAGVTPAEVLLLRSIHGDDAVVDIRPTGEDPKVRVDQEYARLAEKYDRGGGGFGGSPAEERKSRMETLFPGAVKRLPLTFAEAGIDVGSAAESAPLPDLPDVPVGEEPTDEPEATETDNDAEGEAQGDEGGSADAE